MEKRNVPYSPKRCRFCDRPMGIKNNNWYCSKCEEFDDSSYEDTDEVTGSSLEDREGEDE